MKSNVKEWMIRAMIMGFLAGHCVYGEDIYTIDADLTEMTGNAEVASNLTVGSLTMAGETITDWGDSCLVVADSGVLYDTDFSSNIFNQAEWSCNNEVWWTNNSVKFRAVDYSPDAGIMTYSNTTAYPYAGYAVELVVSNGTPYHYDLVVYDGAMQRASFWLQSAGAYTLVWTGSWDCIMISGYAGPPYPTDVYFHELIILQEKSIQIEGVVTEYLYTEKLTVGELTTLNPEALKIGSIIATNIQSGDGATGDYDGKAMTVETGQGANHYGSVDKAGNGGIMYVTTGSGGGGCYGTDYAGDGGDMIIELGDGGNGTTSYGGTENGNGGSFIVRPGEAGTGGSDGVRGAIFLQGNTFIGAEDGSNAVAFVDGMITNVTALHFKRYISYLPYDMVIEPYYDQLLLNGAAILTTESGLSSSHIDSLAYELCYTGSSGDAQGVLRLKKTQYGGAVTNAIASITLSANDDFSFDTDLDMQGNEVKNAVFSGNGSGLYIPQQGDLEMGSYTNGAPL